VISALELVTGTIVAPAGSKVWRRDAFSFDVCLPDGAVHGFYCVRPGDAPAHLADGVRVAFRVKGNIVVSWEPT
jgi:hypothetical protein